MRIASSVKPSSVAAETVGLPPAWRPLRHTHAQTHRQTDRQTDRHTDRQAGTLSLSLSLSLTHTHTHTERERERERERESIERERGREATTSLGILCVQQKLHTVDVAPRRSKMHRTPLLPRRLGTRNAGIYQEAQRLRRPRPRSWRQVHSLPVVVVFGCVIGAK